LLLVVLLLPTPFLLLLLLAPPVVVVQLLVLHSLVFPNIIVRKAAENNNNQLVVIDFTATWCGPCRMIAPIFQELSEAMPDVVFVKVDVDDNPDTAAKYSVSAMPTFVFIQKGKVVDRLMGANPARLQELIDEYK
jgi:thioredoxin 1